MKKRFLFVGIFVVVIILGLSATLLLIPKNATNEKLDKGISELKIDFQEQALNQPDLSFSSNPYDYVKDNENYRQIVTLGYKAIPAIQKKIESSSENGLVEYTLAIAAEEIAQTDLKVVLDGQYKYETAKDFSVKWDSFTSDLKSNIKRVMDKEKDTTRRNKELESLGIFALPYLVDEYKSGDDTLAEVILNLSAKTPEIKGEYGNSKDVYKLINKNSRIISDLRA
ncbi:MAG TPA: hypothetical protein VFD23_02695 [Clostridia bacterium]|nr:hypothetical protein [Clostridia bacterium]